MRTFPEKFPLNPQIQLRDPQAIGPDRYMQYLLSGNSKQAIIVAATGVGKSIMIGEIVRRVLNIKPTSRIGVITMTRELVQQDYKDMKFVCSKIPVGIVMSALGKKEYNKQVIIGSIQSLYKALKHTGKFDFIIIDECHNVPFSDQDTAMYIKFLKANAEMQPKMRMLGLTATPWRGTKPMWGWWDAPFDDVVYEYGLGDALRDGYLVPPETLVSPVQMDRTNLEINKQTGEYTEKSLKAAAEASRGVTEKAVMETLQVFHDEARNSSCTFASSIEHAEEIAQMYRDCGVEARAVHGGMKKAERETTVNRFADGKYQFIVNMMVLTTGWDHKPLDLLTVLREIGSSSTWLQIIGRGMRLSPATNKSYCRVLDYTNSTATHGPLDLIKPPEPPKRKAEAREDALGALKECPDCEELIPASARECPHCQFQFEYETSGLSLNDEATNAAMISSQMKERWLPVSGLECHKHVKPGKSDSLCVRYVNGLKEVTREWLPFDSGFAGQGIAQEKWLRLRGARPAPSSTQEALRRQGELRAPAAITVFRDGDWDRVERLKHE